MPQKDVKVGFGARACGPEAVRGAKSAENHPGLSSRVKRISGKIITAGLSGHQEFLRSDPRRWRSLRHKRQLEVVDDSVHYGEIGEESDDLHLALAF
jgi:hypothetical protein